MAHLTIPANEAEFLKLDVNTQGALWPRCRKCGHIAQGHDTYTTEPKLGSCGEVGPGQCPSCGEWKANVPCKCDGYVGPQNIAELVVWLNRAE